MGSGLHSLLVMEFVDGLIVHLWSDVLLVVHAKHNRADAGFQQLVMSSLIKFGNLWFARSKIRRLD